MQTLKYFHSFTHENIKKQASKVAFSQYRLATLTSPDVLRLICLFNCGSWLIRFFSKYFYYPLYFAYCYKINVRCIQCHGNNNATSELISIHCTVVARTGFSSVISAKNYWCTLVWRHQINSVSRTKLDCTIKPHNATTWPNCKYPTGLQGLPKLKVDNIWNYIAISK